MQNLLLLACLVAVAHAHATIQPPKASLNEYVVAAVRIPHGCQGSATNNVTVVIPDSITKVKPRAVPGWQLQITTKAIPPITGEGGAVINTTVDTVSWFGGRLPDSQFEEFQMQFRTPDAKAGTKIYFPIYQGCEVNQTAWIEIPQSDADKANLPHPAPALTLVDPTAPVTGANTASVAPDGSQARTPSSARALSTHGALVAATATVVAAAVCMFAM